MYPPDYPNPTNTYRNDARLTVFSQPSTSTYGRPDALRELLDGLIAQGRINPADLDDGPGGPLGYLGDVVNAGYRFCRHEPGLDVVLLGTGNIEHLEANLKSINDPPLPPEIATRLEKLFGHIDDVSGN